MSQRQDDAGPRDSAQVGQFLQAARRGSALALGQLLNGCRQYLLLVANEELESDLKAKGGASDLVQETFLEAHQAFGRFQGSSERELLAWLRQILLHNLANFRRRFRGTGQRQLDREVSLDDADHLRGLLEAVGDSPSSAAVRREEVEGLHRAIERLPEHYRQVILLRHRDQRSFEEIGMAMDRSTDAARMLWWRAFECLSAELNPED